MLTKPKTGKRRGISADILDAIRERPSSAPFIFRQMLALRIGPQHLGLSEYFDYRLMDRTPEEQRRYVGWRLWGEIERAAVPQQWWAVVEDKLVLYGLLENFGFPVPRSYALLQANRKMGCLPSFATGAELADFIRSADARFPFFAKPVATGRGEGIAVVEAYCADSDTLQLAHSKQTALSEFVREAAQYIDGGFLLQERLGPHAKIQEISGQAVSTVRFVVTVTRSGPQIMAGAWRIPVGATIVDNFSQTGNLLGGVDLSSGRVTRVTAGAGLAQRSVSEHPTSGLSFAGFILPDWQAACDLVLSCAVTLPEIRLQAWDIGLCDSGPKVVECNVAGDVDVVQIANGCGILSDAFRAFLGEIGVVAC